MSRSSRRAFVLGSGAAALTAPLAMAKLGGGGAPAAAGMKSAALPPSEVAEWERLVGATFLIAGDSGPALAKLVAVERPALDDTRPSALARFQPFTAFLEMDPRFAPVGQQTHRVTHPVKGPIDLFLARGGERRGKAVLLALFN